MLDRRGWEQPLGEWAAPTGVVGIVVAQKFPEPDLIRAKLEEGIDRLGARVTWVIRGVTKKNDAVSIAYEVLRSRGIEPVPALPVPYWGKDARAWRDHELLLTCERLIVFHDISSHVTEFFRDAPYPVAKVFVIERGKKKPTRRKAGRRVDV